MDNVRPGFRWPVAESVSIAVSVKALWEAISAPGNLERCHPFCAQNPVLEWPGEGSRDEVHYLNGRVFVRRFYRWVEGVGYDLEIGSRRGPSSHVSWRILPHDGHATLRITVYPFLLQQLPAAIRWLPHRLHVRPMLESYLSSVLRGFEWFLTRGKPVAPNQFGSHPWFSSTSS